MKIAIKLPDSLDQRVLTFPFLHSLKRYLDRQLEQMEEEDECYEIHLIANVEHIDVLNLLPFEAYYHEMTSDDLKTVFSVHRAIKNSKLIGIDTFISMTESFVDASIGKNLNASQTVGYNTGKIKFLFKAKVPYLKGQHQSDIYYQLLKGICESELPVIPDVYSRELTPFYTDWSSTPYSLINLDVKKKEINQEWKDFFELFEGQTFVLMCDSLDKHYQKDKLQDFIKELKKTNDSNEYRILEHESNIDFAKIVSFSQTFITGDSPLVHVASYVKAHTFWLNKKSNRKAHPIYSLGEIRVFNLNEPQYKDGGGVKYNLIFDEMYSYIDARSMSSSSGQTSKRDNEDDSPE